MGNCFVEGMILQMSFNVIVVVPLCEIQSIRIPTNMRRMQTLEGHGEMNEVQR